MTMFSVFGLIWMGSMVWCFRGSRSVVMSQLTGICQQGGDTPGIHSFIVACAALCRARCCCCYIAMEKRSASVLEAFSRTATQSGFKVVRHSHPLGLGLCLHKKSPTAGDNGHVKQSSRSTHRLIQRCLVSVCHETRKVPCAGQEYDTDPAADKHSTLACGLHGCVTVPKELVLC